MIQLHSIRDVKLLKGKKVLLRVAYDVPLMYKGKQVVVADDRRIRETIPTIEFLRKQGCKIVLLSWLGRPDGKVDPKLSMSPIADRLSQMLKRPVQKINDCIGPKVFEKIQKLKAGEILMLENVRFYPQEEANDKHFAALLVHGLDIIVFDAFAQAHRVHASTVGITKLLPTYSGFLLEKEIRALTQVIDKPRRPLVVIVGGAKLSDKIGILEELVKKADKILVGGGCANIFLQAAGIKIGKSFTEDAGVDKAKKKKVNYQALAKKLLKKYPEKFLLPLDAVSANRKDDRALIELIDFGRHDINPNWMFLDIGPKTIAHFMAEIKRAKTIFFNGPMGVFELPRFAFGTRKIAEAVARSGVTSVVGGGDTERVVTQYNLEGKFSHVSTGGGASLEFIAGHELPGLQFLKPNHTYKAKK